jgi:hypothetical protein
MIMLGIITTTTTTTSSTSSSTSTSMTTTGILKWTATCVRTSSWVRRPVLKIVQPEVVVDVPLVQTAVQTTETVQTTTAEERKPEKNEENDENDERDQRAETHTETKRDRPEGNAGITKLYMQRTNERILLLSSSIHINLFYDIYFYFWNIASFFSKNLLLLLLLASEKVSVNNIDR